MAPDYADPQSGKVLQDFEVHEELDRQSARDKPMMVRWHLIRWNGNADDKDGYGMAE